MKKDKQASFADLNFDQLVSSEDFEKIKVAPKKRFSNAIKCIIFGLIGVGIGCSLFYLLYYFAR
ncbi:MAG: hypothetical protein K2L48_05255 [Mycoplasmoidaceae bacterium]|nr:hypothetical protein [Mycoplasmoidaceae bacterium]